MSRNFCVSIFHQDFAWCAISPTLAGVFEHITIWGVKFAALEYSRKLVISLLSLLRFLGRLVLEMCAPKHSIIFLFEHRLDSSE